MFRAVPFAGAGVYVAVMLECKLDSSFSLFEGAD